MTKQFLVPTGMHLIPTYSHAVKAGKTIYLSGQVGRNAQGQIVSDDVQKQTEQVFENLKLALQAAGATFADLVKLTIFLTDIKTLPTVNGVRSRYLKPPMPASTVVEVSNLAPGFLVEIDGIAVIDD